MKNAHAFYSEIARKVNAFDNCVKLKNGYENNHFCAINEMVADYLPRGSGFDMGTKFLMDESNQNKLVFEANFHHMDENGYYNGWTEHKVIITPDLMFGFNIKVAGKNRNDIKEYIHSCFSDFDYPRVVISV